MKWNILHESRGRIRLHLNKPRLSMAEADQLQAYLADLPACALPLCMSAPVTRHHLHGCPHRCTARRSRLPL